MMVKLKLTPWAEEMIKQGRQSLTNIDPEVHLAFVQGLVDMGEGSSVVVAKDRRKLLVTKVVGYDLGPGKISEGEKGGFVPTPVTQVFAYDMKTWQVVMEPKRAEKK